MVDRAVPQLADPQAGAVAVQAGRAVERTRRSANGGIRQRCENPDGGHAPAGMNPRWNVL